MDSGHNRRYLGRLGWRTVGQFGDDSSSPDRPDHIDGQVSIYICHDTIRDCVSDNCRAIWTSTFHDILFPRFATGITYGN